MKRSTLQLLGTAIIAFVIGIVMGGYLVPSQGPTFGGFSMRPTINTFTVATTHSPTFIGPVTIFHPTFSMNTQPVGCDISVSPLLAVFDLVHPSAVVYTIDVKPHPSLKTQPVYLDASASNWIVSSAIFSQGANQAVMPPFTSVMTIPVSTFIRASGNNISLLVPPGTYPITIYTGIPDRSGGGLSWTTVCSENVSIEIKGA